MNSSVNLRKGHMYPLVLVVSDEPRHLLRGVCTVQRGVGHVVPGALEEEGCRVGVQVGNAGLSC